MHLQTMSASRARQVGIKSSEPWLRFSSKVLNLDISSNIIFVRRGTLLRLKRTPMCRRLCPCSLGSLQKQVSKLLFFFLIIHSRNRKKGRVSILNKLAVDSGILNKFTGWRMYALVDIERVERYFIWTYSNQGALKVVRKCCKLKFLCGPTALGSFFHVLKIALELTKSLV